MTVVEHYQAAEKHLDRAQQHHDEGEAEDAQAHTTMAQAHAVLALVGLTAELHRLDGRPLTWGADWGRALGWKEEDF